MTCNTIMEGKKMDDLSTNVAELTKSVQDLRAEVADLNNGLKAKIKLRQDMRGEKIIFLKGVLWALSALVFGTLLTCWANGLLIFSG